MDATTDTMSFVEQELFESVEEIVLDVAAGVEYLHSKPSENTCYSYAALVRVSLCVVVFFGS